MKTKFIDKEILIDLYVNQGLTRHQVAEKLGVVASTVLKYLRRHGISTRTVSSYLKNRSKSPEHRAKISVAMSGDKNPNFGKKQHSHGKRCWYIMPNGMSVSMRSRWEVWYAEYLRENGIDFQYEAVTFHLADGRAYTPDFYLPKENRYVEVKGWFRKEHMDKLEAFRQFNPNIDVLLADGPYLKNLGIDLNRKWVADQPTVVCVGCQEEFHRKSPTQKFCGIRCRNINNSRRLADPSHDFDKIKRRYSGDQSGARNNGSKLSEGQVVFIKSLRKDGCTYKQIQQQTGASLGNIGNILSGKSWSHL